MVATDLPGMVITILKGLKAPIERLDIRERANPFPIGVDTHQAKAGMDLPLPFAQELMPGGEFVVHVEPSEQILLRLLMKS